jgi:hypothetical protein
LQRNDLRALGAGEDFDGKRAAAARLVQSPLEIVTCPSRRGPELSAYDPKFVPFNSDPVLIVAKSDYAANAGDDGLSPGEGPRTLAEGDDPEYAWHDPARFTGISFQRSEIGMSDVLDGKSHTYLLGEKYLSLGAYGGGFDPGDDQSIYSGYNYDVNRWASPGWPPTQDSEAEGFWRFGSVHFGSCHFSFVDGSVRPISYWIDDEVNRRLGNRRDRMVIDDAALVDGAF